MATTSMTKKTAVPARKNGGENPVSLADVQKRVVVVRGMSVILDVDVAALYGVETKRVNEAVRNNPDKFPSHYMFGLSMSELHDLRSKILTTNVSVMNHNPT